MGAVAAGLTAPPDEHPDVSGIIIDIPSSGGFVSVVVLTDDTTSMYTSVGGGIIGAGAHAPVAEANRHLLAVVQAHLGLFKSRSDDSLPKPGLVRFHVLGRSMRRGADVGESVFWGQVEDPLTPVVASVQDLITALTKTSPQ